MKNHTSILESTLNIIKNDEANLQKQNDHLNMLTESFKNFSNSIENEEKMHNFLMYFNQMVNEYDRQQTAVIDVITNCNRDFISHEIFTASQIEHQVDLISRQIGTEYRVPSGIDVYSVSKISVFRLNKQFVFKISIPLLKTTKHKLYKILRIPAILNNRFLWVQNSHKFLIATVDRTLHQFLDDLASCIPYNNKETLICSKPTHWFTTGKPDCVWEIFNHLPRRGCDMVESEPESFVLGLDRNQFIFVLAKPIKVTIICKDLVNHDWLGGEGLLTLNPYCTLTGDNLQLDTIVNINNNSEIVIPKLDIVSDWSLTSKSTFNLSTIALTNNQTIIELQNHLNATKMDLESIRLRPDFSHHDAIHYSFFTFIVVIFIIYKTGIYRILFKSNGPKMPKIDAPLNSSNCAPENVDTT